MLYFLKLGCIGFGGPIALVGYMQKDLVDERKWISQEDYLNGLAFSQLAPGPLAAQLAMYLGFVRAGFIGATIVGAAFILPSFLMVLAIGKAYVTYGGTRIIAALFYGIGAAVIAIVARSAIKLIKTSIKKDKLLWAVFLVLGLSTAMTEKEIVWFFLGGGLFVTIARTDFSAWRRQRSASSFLPPTLISFSPGILSTTGSLFLFFLKSSLFVFGSGLAMITPGPVVITVAFIGYLVSGMIGASAAALGVFLPVYLFVVLVGPFYKRFSGNTQVRAFVQGVTAAATGAIAGAVVVLGQAFDPGLLDCRHCGDDFPHSAEMEDSRAVDHCGLRPTGSCYSPSMRAINHYMYRSFMLRLTGRAFFRTLLVLGILVAINGLMLAETPSVSARRIGSS